MNQGKRTLPPPIIMVSRTAIKWLNDHEIAATMGANDASRVEILLTDADPYETAELLIERHRLPDDLVIEVGTGEVDFVFEDGYGWAGIRAKQGE